MGRQGKPINISYIYFMQILRKHQLNIRQRYLYIAAILFSFIVILQLSRSIAFNNLPSVLRYTVLFVSNYFVWIFLIDYIYGLVQPFQERERSLPKLIFETLISSVLLLLFHLFITNLIYYAYLVSTTDLQVNEVLGDFGPFFWKSVLSRLLDLLIIICLIKIIEWYWTLQKQKLMVVTLENQLHLSQLEALRAQLDPHFLFNTLHTLNTLIGYDDEKARSMIIKVTHLLRKLLDQRGKHLITFEEELAYFKSYLDIEQERFYDRLKVNLEVGESTKSIMVPTLMLQPLIENAFKHGISLMEGEAILDLCAKTKGDRLVVVLQNSIPKAGQQSTIPSTKLGLNNLRNRMDQLFGTGYELSVQREADRFMVSLSIPIK